MQRGSDKATQIGRTEAHNSALLGAGAQKEPLSWGCVKGKEVLPIQLELLLNTGKGTSAHVKGFQRGGLSMSAQ